VKLWYFNERSMALSGDKITKTVAGRLRLLDKTKSKRGKWYVEPRACYEPALRMPAACWRKRQTKATKCNPAKVAGSLS
jgi:hypothetical protein